MVTMAEAESQVARELLRVFSSAGFEKASPFLLIRQRAEGTTWQLRCGARRDQVSKTVLIGLSAGLRFESVETFLHPFDPHALHERLFRIQA